MKRFILQITLFTALLLTGMMLLFAGRRWTHAPYRLPENVTILMTGDSHVQTAVNDAGLDRVRNVALDSEGYVYSLSKIDTLCRNNPQINTVILGVSYHNLSGYYDDYILGQYADAVLTRFVDLLDPRHMARLLLSKPSLTVPVMHTLLTATADPYPYIGEFAEQDTDHLSVRTPSVLKRLRYQYYSGDRLRPVSRLNLEYLRRIVTLCRESGLTLMFMNTPMHPSYQNGIPEKYVGLYRETTAEYDVPVIDFSDLDLSDRDFLPDGDHLNSRGAAAATRYIQRLLDGAPKHPGIVIPAPDHAESVPAAGGT